jgi:BirA family biotin operon repressor/biotin-[acetyl-CoA-carboxylase] ligase
VAGRKIAGVLVEMTAQRAAAHLAVLGIGLNVNQDADDFPAELRERAISLAMVTGARQDRHQLAVALLRNLDRRYFQTFSSV